MQRIILTSVVLASAFMSGSTVLAKDPPAGANATAAVNACARIKTTGWKAWLDTMPPGPRTLHVQGEATVPSTGWTLELKPGPLNKMLPPTQIFLFVATPPTKPITGPVVIQQRVTGEIKNALPHYKAVSILCGKTTVATVPVKIIT